MGVLLAALGGVQFVGVGEAAAALEFCERASSGRQCASLTVPLDRTGAVPGTVKLHVERQRAKRAVRPPLFLITGPGQSNTDAFDSEVVEDIVGTEARSRDIVVMDLRGTGRSGALNCPALQRSLTRPALAKPADIPACAAQLGARRDFFSSIDIADDIDAVRAALGADRMAIYGVSHGSYVAQVYARRYPTRIDRVVLDSVVAPTGIDAFNRTSMAAFPGALESLCGRRSCRHFLRHPGGAARRLAERLERRPLTGYVVDRQGRRQRASIDGDGLLSLATTYPLVSAGLPAAVAAAARGDSAPLLRAQSDLARFVRFAGTTRPRDSSVAAAIATSCSDTVLPWSATTSVEGRRAVAIAAADAMPPEAFAPFGPRTALESGAIEQCGGWPSSARPRAAAGSLPDIPALLLAGAADVSTPVANARALHALLPRSELVVIPAVGHDVMQSETACAGRAVRRFLAGGTAGRCGRPVPDRAGALPAPPPVSLGQVSPSGSKGRPGRTLTAVTLTLIDSFQSLLVSAFLEMARSEDSIESGRQPRAGALRGGSYVGTRHGWALRRASFVPGVRVTGTVRADMSGRVRGAFTVTGRSAAHGRLRLSRHKLRGVIAGRPVRVHLDLLERALGISPSGALAAVRGRGPTEALFSALWP